MDSILEIEPDQQKSYYTKKFKNVIFYHSIRLKKGFWYVNFLVKKFFGKPFAGIHLDPV